MKNTVVTDYCYDRSVDLYQDEKMQILRSHIQITDRNESNFPVL